MSYIIKVIDLLYDANGNKQWAVFDKHLNSVNIL